MLVPINDPSRQKIVTEFCCNHSLHQFTENASLRNWCWWNAFNLICGLNCRSDLIWISWTAVWSPLVKRAHKCIAFVSSCFNYAFMTEDRGELPASSYRPNYDAIGDDIVYSTIGVRQMKWTSVCLVSQLLVCMCQSFNETSGAVGLSGYVLKRHWFV